MFNVLSQELANNSLLPNVAMPIHLRVTYNCLYITTELNSCKRD